MKVTLTEDKYAYILFNKMLDKVNNLNENFNPFERTISNRKKRIKDWLNQFGTPLNNIENGRKYIVYKIPGIEEVLGTSYCICRMIDEYTGNPRGVLEVKPMECFQ